MARRQPPAEVWQRDDIRKALARHDIGTVYRILQRHGIPQRVIAVLTGQSETEVCEIASGRLAVTEAYSKDKSDRGS
jgi:hypothetical protein